jgi:hypothetical protein
MVWSEYLNNETVWEDAHSDEENEPPITRLTCDEWTTWYSQDLLNMWFSLRQYREDSGLQNHILEGGSYTDFCEFCYRFSNGYVY